MQVIRPAVHSSRKHRPIFAVTSMQQCSPSLNTIQKALTSPLFASSTTSSIKQYALYHVMMLPYILLVLLCCLVLYEGRVSTSC